MTSSSDRSVAPRVVWSKSPPTGARETFIPSQYVLRGAIGEPPLREGETVLGRDPENHIVVDSPRVSRQHAAVLVSGDDVSLRDLGSRNGVMVNGVKIEEEVKLREGDLVLIGDTRFTLVRGASRSTSERNTTVPPPPKDDDRSSTSATRETSKASAFELLKTIADKAFAIGSTDDVIRLLGGHIRLTHDWVKLDQPVEDHQVLAASCYAIRLAVATKDTEWARLALDMLESRQLIPAPELVDELYSMASDLRTHHTLVQRYARSMGRRRDELTPTERFALKRLEGLERLIALKTA